MLLVWLKAIFYTLFKYLLTMWIN